MNNKKIKKSFIFVLQKGFSLIELLVVVAIIGILAGIGIIAYDSYVEYTRRVANEANAKLLAAAFIAERTAQEGKLSGRVCSNNIAGILNFTFGNSSQDNFSACLNALMTKNQIKNPYTQNSYGANGDTLWLYPSEVSPTDWSTPNFSNNTYYEDGYTVSGGDCSDVGGFITVMVGENVNTRSSNKPFLATCKRIAIPDNPEYYDVRVYKFFSLIE
jgi:prepilin-type N-terminal cleavage/methylation domain-containing protein